MVSVGSTPILQESNSSAIFSVLVVDTFMAVVYQTLRVNLVKLAMTKLGKPTDTTLSVSTFFDIPELVAAKEFLTTKYASHYGMSPHLTYVLGPFPRYNLKTLEVMLDEYFANLTQFNIVPHGVELEPKYQFFSLPVTDKQVMVLHTELLGLINKQRDGCVRTKDIVRFDKGLLSEKEVELIKNYGYFRVLSNFVPHLTLGDVETSTIDLPKVQRRLASILSQVIGKPLVVRQVSAELYVDAAAQTEITVLWQKKYQLKRLT